MAEDVFGFKDLVPRAVVCTRGKNSFDAEILVQGFSQRVVSRGHETREAARGAAQVIADAIEKDMMAAAAGILDQFPEAKP